MPYTYDYTNTAAGDDGVLKYYWRFAKMTLTRWTRAKIFFFDGRSYPYFYHFCNKTWKNERGVEIPIFREILLRHQAQRILEVGNVLSHYLPVHHDVVDKYEVAPGVINQDILTYTPTERYDLILSISTLEHIGWDETPCEPNKLLRVIEHLRSRCLAPRGKLVASLPIGYNTFFDELLRDGKSPFTRQQFLKRISTRNYWVESDWDGCRDMAYGRFVAHAICIGSIQG
jgi:hypothetical protein